MSDDEAATGGGCERCQTPVTCDDVDVGNVGVADQILADTQQHYLEI